MVSIHSRLRRRLKVAKATRLSRPTSGFNPQPTPSPAEGWPPRREPLPTQGFNPQPTPSPAEGGRAKRRARVMDVSIHSRLRRRLKGLCGGQGSDSPVLCFNPQPTPSPAEGGRRSRGVRHLPVSIHSRLRRRLKARSPALHPGDCCVSIHSRLRRRLKVAAAGAAALTAAEFQSTADSVAG